jgi:hypothetical protein
MTRKVFWSRATPNPITSVSFPIPALISPPLKAAFVFPVRIENYPAKAVVEYIPVPIRQVGWREMRLVKGLYRNIRLARVYESTCPPG